MRLERQSEAMSGLAQLSNAILSAAHLVLRQRRNSGQNVSANGRHFGWWDETGERISSCIADLSKRIE